MVWGGRWAVCVKAKGGSSWFQAWLTSWGQASVYPVGEAFSTSRRNDICSPTSMSYFRPWTQEALTSMDPAFITGPSLNHSRWPERSVIQ